MTVPGKGGRPRKWVTDADRQAAFRARQTGIPEPVMFVEALDNGDELAHAIARVEELNRELATARKTEQSLRRELRASEKRTTDLQRQFAWLDTTVDRERQQNLNLIAERNDLAAQVRHLTTDLARLEHQRANPPRPAPTATPPPPVLSRADRRRLERQQRKQ